MGGQQGLFERIYAAVRGVPQGRVTTYGEIARQVGLRNGARTVGWALASLPDGEAAPWWRVVRSDGTIANRQFAAEQRKRLRRDGVRFTRSGSIDLARYGLPSGASTPGWLTAGARPATPPAPQRHTP
ncbi:MAG: MGMT family protein [bacterium]|nr:MGMT family protein [bacterium]